MGPKQNRKHEHSSMKMSVSRKSQAKLAFVVTTLVLLTFSSSFASQANSLAASRFLSASIAQGEQGTIKVGTVLYLWYGLNYTYDSSKGGLLTSHWNDSTSTRVEDRPYFGYYSSENEISEQIRLIEATGFNFIVVSWWGWGVTNFSNPRVLNGLDSLINSETWSLFKDIERIHSNLQVAILVDDFTDSSALNTTDYQEIYNYVYDNFYSPFANITLNYEGHPLLLWFNPLSPKLTNSTFTSRVVGNNLAQAQWIWWKAPAKYFDSYGGSDDQLCQCYVGNPQISSDGFVSIIARYDDYYLYPSSQRTGYMRVDYTLAQGLYAYEWDFVINQSRFNRDVQLILVNSWNEYHERSEIEPHYDYSDPTAQPFLLTNSTRQYISELESAPGLSQIEVQEYEAILTAAIAVSVLLVTVYSFRKFIRARG